MSTRAIETSPSRRRAYGLLIVTELRLAWRYPVGLIFGVGLPMLLLVVFGSIPSLTQPNKEFGGLSFFTVYAPTLMVLVLLGLAGVPVGPGLFHGRRRHRLTRRPLQPGPVRVSR
jgi:ABC-2 type transport system permease protein